MRHHARESIRPAVLGVVAGFLSGLFGVGGGILIVPVLVLLLGMAQRRAHGTSLAAVLPIAVSGTVGFALDGSVDWPVAVALSAGASFGAVIGTYALARISLDLLTYVFSATLILSAARLVFDHAEAGGRADLHLLAMAGLVLVGVVSGTTAGLLGVGGGIVMVPAMIILFGVPAAVAKGTSLAVIVPTAVLGTLRNRRNGNADLRTAVIVGLAGVGSALAGSSVSLGLSESASNAMFALLLVVVAGQMLVRHASQRRAGATSPILVTDQETR